MNDLINKVSTIVSGSMIYGALFPAILFFALLSLVVLPITPYGAEFTALMKNPSGWQANGISALLAMFIIVLLTVMLYQFNNGLTRFYEGYPWKDSYIGQKLCKRHQERFVLARETKTRIGNLGRDASLENLGFRADELNKMWGLAADILDNEYPNAKELVLPTRLGNIIRAFETYTQRRYGASQLALWARLQAVIEPPFMDAINGAKTQFDFMLNSSFLSGVLAFLLLAAGLIWRHPKNHGLLQPWLFEIPVFLFMSYLLYLGAGNRAAEWGVGVKASFDLYRFALLKKLGYDLVPADLQEERKIWDIISYHLAFPSDDDAYPELPYKPQRTSLIVEPSRVVVTFRRTIIALGDDVTQVRVVVINNDPGTEAASSVVLQEETPPASVYVKDSATVDGVPAVLLSVDPLKMQIGPVPFQQSRTAVYHWKKQAEKK